MFSFFFFLEGPVPRLQEMLIFSFKSIRMPVQVPTDCTDSVKSFKRLGKGWQGVGDRKEVWTTKNMPKDKRGGMNLKKNGGSKIERMSVKLETLVVMTQSPDFKGFAHCEGPHQSACFYNVVGVGPISNSQNSTTVKCEYRTGQCVQTENGAEKSLFLRYRGQTLSKLHKGVQSRKLLYLFWEAPDQGQKWILIRVQEVKDVSPQCKSVFISFCSPYLCPFFKGASLLTVPFFLKPWYRTEAH